MGELWDTLASFEHLRRWTMLVSSGLTHLVRGRNMQRPWLHNAWWDDTCWGQPLTRFGNKCCARFAMLVVICMALSIHWVATWLHVQRCMQTSRDSGMLETQNLLKLISGWTARIFSIGRYAVHPHAHWFSLCSKTRSIPEIVACQNWDLFYIYNVPKKLFSIQRIRYTSLPMTR